MRLAVIFLLFFFVYALSNAQEIKLFKKNIRLSYPDYEFYPLFKSKVVCMLLFQKEEISIV